MSFINKIFGKKQPIPPAEIDAETELTATKLHEVITSMCASPSSFRSSHSYRLYELLPTSTIPKKVADLFVDVTSFRIFLFNSDTGESMVALEELCSIKGKVVSNLLHCIANMSDDKQHVPTQHRFISSINTIEIETRRASFESQRRLARAELARRGSPKYDPHYYVIK